MSIIRAAMKKLRLDLVAPVPPEEFCEIYDGEKFREFVIRTHPHIESVEILERREDEHTRFTRTRTTMRIDLPGFLSVLKTVVKPHNEEEQTFYKKELRYEFRSFSSISRSNATIRLLPEQGGTHTRRVVELELEATKGPGFIRGRAEEFFIEKAKEQMAIYQDVVRQYFGDRWKE